MLNDKKFINKNVFFGGGGGGHEKTIWGGGGHKKTIWRGGLPKKEGLGQFVDLSGSLARKRW